ncbi:hypothetical protein [Nocardia jiangxiensis]|uniref:hypothetical protein n=1 Tax=Nocardia jiangxiensis TaxID=282685 RepID=UPI0002D533F2|nr:hypothetical protein [Nocardia jiangxiensis]
MIKLGKTVTLINERDFSALVTKTYQRPYSFQQQGNMMGQDTIHEFSLPLEYEFDDDDDYGWNGPSLLEWCTAPLGEFEYKWQRDMHWHREYYPEFEAVITDLYARGLIPAGDYALHISW